MNMNFIVIGCGRVGSQLSYQLFKHGHQVVVVDSNKNSFNRLHSDFHGRTVEGYELSADTLTRAGVSTADGVAVVTNSDIMNAVIGHAVRSHYPQVKRVIVRNYDPALREMLEAFGLQIVSSTAWGAERLQELLIDASFRAVFSAGNGEVELYEMYIPESWSERTVSSLLDGYKNKIVIAALTRAGRAEVASAETVLKSGDILTVSATLEGVTALHARLQEGTEA
jgi:trk system potassium uptake protein TrkA